ncbi:MAG: ribose 5-phosphate isomerase B [Flavobacteriia bacterium]|jgi:ribose 5-phosphate isomerase B|nr:ribose 5-phosphate isomerase B [Flavobacteriia bacterium]
MKIAMGNDHAGVEMKEQILSHLKTKGHRLTNYGTDTGDSVDYADFIHPVAEEVAQKKADLGIIICGSGNGAAMTANKHQAIRAALCWNAETARLSREHNDANILSIPARFVSIDTAIVMVELFLETPFEGGRHKKRIDKIPCV